MTFICFLFKIYFALFGFIWELLVQELLPFILPFVCFELLTTYHLHLRKYQIYEIQTRQKKIPGNMELSGQINTTTTITTTTTTWISNGTGGHIYNNNNTVGNFHFEPPDDSELLILQSIQLFFQVINVFFHTMGVTFLWALYERTEHKVILMIQSGVTIRGV